MNNIMDIINEFQKPCPCGCKHTTAIKDIEIGSGIVKDVGYILARNNFPRNILLVADKNTIAAADGIMQSLDGYNVEFKIYDELRVARTEHVEELEALIKDRNIAILSVGTGSINDPCRVACANQNKKLCIFATAPSMDGFASYSSPIVVNGFKVSLPAKSPEVIIGDTKILAAAPKHLKSSGFGDMIAKYVALIDWKISSILTDEVYCERVAGLTRQAVDILMKLSDKVTVNDEETAGEIFKSLLMTGIGMSFTQTSRPASGAEHVIAHLVECIELRDDIIPNFHGEDVGVCTLMMLKYYNKLAESESIEVQKDPIDLEDIYKFYGELADDVKKLNEPKTVTDEVNLSALKERWQEIRDIIHSVPSYEECLQAMKNAGCKLTIKDIGKSEKLIDDCTKYSPYMRYRLTLLRMKDMIITEEEKKLKDLGLFLFDLDGTLYLGNNLFHYTKELLEVIKKQGKRYIFITNNSSKSVEDYIKKFAMLGIEAHADEFFTSSQATAIYLQAHHPNDVLYVCGTKSLKEELIKNGFEVTEDLDRVNCVVMGNDTELTFKKLDDVSRLLTLKKDIHYIATNPDPVCPTEYGSVPDCGSFCDAIFNATGRRPIFIGKPEPDMPIIAAKRAGYDVTETAVVGDRLYTDIASGINASCTSILVLSGETTEEILEKSETKPDIVLNSCNDLLNTLKK